MTSEKRMIEKEIYIAYDGKEFDDDVTCLKYEKQKHALESIKCRESTTRRVVSLIQYCIWDEEEKSFFGCEFFDLINYFSATTDYEKDLINYLISHMGYCSAPYECFDFDLVYWDK